MLYHNYDIPSYHVLMSQKGPNLSVHVIAGICKPCVAKFASKNSSTEGEIRSGLFLGIRRYSRCASCLVVLFASCRAFSGCIVGVTTLLLHGVASGNKQVLQVLWRV
jgi:hypothetical protein